MDKWIFIHFANAVVAIDSSHLTVSEMEPGRPGHGSPGRRVNILGRVGSGHGSVSNTHDPVF